MAAAKKKAKAPTPAALARVRRERDAAREERDQLRVTLLGTVEQATDSLSAGGFYWYGRAIRSLIGAGLLSPAEGSDASSDWTLRARISREGEEVLRGAQAEVDEERGR